MSGNSAGGRHFGFAQVALCALADSKTTGKSGELQFNQFNVVCQFRVNSVKAFRMKKESGLISISRSKIRPVESKGRATTF